MLRMTLVATLLAVSIGAGGCRFQPAKEIDPEQGTGMKKGPGLFTGRQGEWVIHRQQ